MASILLTCLSYTVIEVNTLKSRFKEPSQAFMSEPIRQNDDRLMRLLCPFSIQLIVDTVLYFLFPTISLYLLTLVPWKVDDRGHSIVPDFKVLFDVFKKHLSRLNNYPLFGKFKTCGISKVIVCPEYFDNICIVLS